MSLNAYYEGWDNVLWLRMKLKDHRLWIRTRNSLFIPQIRNIASFMRRKIFLWEFLYIHTKKCLLLDGTIHILINKTCVETSAITWSIPVTASSSSCIVTMAVHKVWLVCLCLQVFTLWFYRQFLFVMKYFYELFISLNFYNFN